MKQRQLNGSARFSFQAKKQNSCGTYRQGCDQDKRACIAGSGRGRRLLHGDSCVFQDVVHHIGFADVSVTVKRVQDLDPDIINSGLCEGIQDLGALAPAAEREETFSSVSRRLIFTTG